MDTPTKEDRVRVAVVTGAKGLRGDVKLKPFTEMGETLCALREFSSEDGQRNFRGVCKQEGRVIVARFDGIENRESAEALKGVELFVPTSELQPLDADEFYYRDLEGLEARDDEGTVFGKVLRVADYGAGDLLEVEVGSTGETAFVPFVKDYVPAIDVQNGFAVIIGIEDFLDGETKEENGGTS